MEPWTLYLLAGIAVFTITLMRLHFKRKRRETAESARRRAAAQIARAEQDKMMAKMGKQVETKDASCPSTQTGRIPLADVVGTSFTGAAKPGSIARWETEVHEIGRQITGKIDSKMVALQTLTMEANRAANRMELLLERFEKMVRQQTAPKPTSQNDDTASSTGQPTVTPAEPTRELPATDEPVQNILPAGQTPGLASYADILNDLESEIEQLSEDTVFAVVDEAAPVTVLKAAGNVPAGLALSSPSLPGEKTEMPRESLPLTSLYADDLESIQDGRATPPLTPVEKSGTPPFAVAGSHLDLRKQVEMMSDYGYTPRQIAQSLNITQGEVDLMLNLRG